MPVTIKTGVGGGSVTLDSGTGVLDTTLTLPNINGTVLYSDANGNVGIGTSSPDSSLHVYKSATGAEAVLLHLQNGGSGSAIATLKIGEGSPESQYGVLGNYGIDNSFRIGAVGSGAYMSFHTGSIGSTNLSTNERMRINSSGYLGIGTTSPSAPLDVLVSAGGVSPARFISSASGGGNIYLGCTNASTTVNGYIGPNAYTNNVFAIGVSTSTPLTFLTAATECGRFDANGNFLVGMTTAIGIGINSSSNFYVGSAGSYWKTTNFSATYYFNYNGSDKAAINGSTGAYTALSDANKKKDFEASIIGLAEVMQLQPKMFRMLDDADDAPKQLGFIAQEVQPLIPQAYSEQDGPDGKKFIGLQDRPIIAALTKAIQELSAKNDALEARLAALENK